MTSNAPNTQIATTIMAFVLVQGITQVSASDVAVKKKNDTADINK